MLKYIISNIFALYVYIIYVVSHISIGQTCSIVLPLMFYRTPK